MPNSKALFDAETNVKHGTFLNFTYRTTTTGEYVSSSLTPSYGTLTQFGNGGRRITLDHPAASIVWVGTSQIASGSNLSGSIRVLKVDTTNNQIELQEQVNAAGVQTDRKLNSITGSICVLVSPTV